MSSPPVNEKEVFEDELRDAMTALGFSEMLNYSFYGTDDIEKCGLNAKGHFEIANPINPEQKYMRTSLMPGILKNVRLNLKNFDKFSIFEIGKIYLAPNKKMPDEEMVLAGASVNIENKKDIFFELKGKVEALLEKLGIKDTGYEIRNTKYEYHPTRSAVIKSGNEIIGYLGEINPQLASKYKIKTRNAAIFKLDIAKMQNFTSSQREYKPLSKFPSVKRDVSMFVKKDTKYNEIVGKIKEAGGKLVLSVELFDVFEKAGEKSLAIRIEIGSREKTLTSAEIDAVMKKIITRLEKDLKVKVRKQ